MAPPARVLYPLSADLIAAADALPSNLGRSRRVHSLVYHLGLLDLPRVGAGDDEECAQDSGEDSADEDGDGDEDEERRLLRMLAGSDAHWHAGSASASASAGEGAGLAHSDGGHLPRAEVTPPQPALEAQLQAYHGAAYVEALLGVGRCGSEEDSDGDNPDETYGLVDDCPRFPLLASHVSHIAGASIFAAQALAADHADIAIVWDGGRHHAHKGRAAGFCYVNDAVLAILEMRKPRKVRVSVGEGGEGGEGGEEGEVPVRVRVEHNEQARPQTHTSTAPRPLGFGARPEEIRNGTHASNTRKRPSANPQSPGSGSGSATPAKKRTLLKRLERILYLDLDLHWGDGVEEAFRGSTSVLTLSLHNHGPGFYPPAPGLPPGDGDGEHAPTDPFALSLPLHPGLGAHTLTHIWTECVLPVLRAYEPQAIVLQLGLDGLAGDPTAQWNLDSGSVLRAVESVLAYARARAAVKVKVLLLGGGGYDSPNAARGWAAVTALALGRLHVGQGADGDGDGGGDGGGGEHEQAEQTHPHTKTAEEEEEEQAPQDVDMRSVDADADADAGAKGHGLAPAPSAPLTLSSPVPYHAFWPEYGPAFTLDVPAGQMPDVLHPPSYTARLAAHVQRHLPAIRAVAVAGAASGAGAG